MAVERDLQAAALELIGVPPAPEVRLDHERRVVLLPAPEPAGRVDRMHDGCHEPAARLQDPRQLANCAGHVVHVHQSHERDDEIGRAVLERQLRSIRLDVLAVGIRLPRGRDQRRRRVDADHPVAERAQVARHPTLAAPDVQRQPARGRERRQQGFAVEAPIAVVTRLARPPDPVRRLRLPGIPEAHATRAGIGVSTTSLPASSTRYACVPSSEATTSRSSPIIRFPMTPQRYVYDFDEPTDGGRELLGGKGIGLAEMTQLGIPVPAGFTITTDACRAYMTSGGELPEGLEQEIDEHLARLEERTGKRFGDPKDPLLVSVRSGAAISMPGMMDTILNVGLNDEALAGGERFVQDSYRRLIQMYGETVDHIDSHRFSDALDEDDLPKTIETFKRIYREETGRDFPQDAQEQLGRAVRAVFDSWNTPRAQAYRRHNDIPDDLGTAVNVVQMVFGNKGEQSGTGVAFTRDPSTGEQGLYGEFLADAQGEDVVAGIRTPDRVEAMKERLPGAFEELVATMRRLEEHYKDMQDIEFTVEDGKLYFLQTRSAKRTAAAALKAAVNMVDEGL